MNLRKNVGCASSYSDPIEGVCPPGFYCEEGSGVPTPCPAGTLSDEWGNPNVTYCLPCPAGFYCSGLHVSNDFDPILTKIRCVVHGPCSLQ